MALEHARIEQRLGLSLVPRSNRVAILGEAYAADVARAGLEDLYQRLKSGLEVTAADVDGAVRMAEVILGWRDPVRTVRGLA